MSSGFPPFKEDLLCKWVTPLQLKISMSDYNVDDFTFEALCLPIIGDKINTLAYVVGLVDSVTHPAGDPDTARYNILYSLSDAEEHMETPEDLLDWQADMEKILPQNYL